MLKSADVLAFSSNCYYAGKRYIKLFACINQLPISNSLPKSRREAFLTITLVCARGEAACAIGAALVIGIAAGAQWLTASAAATSTAIVLWILQACAASIHAASVGRFKTAVLAAPSLFNVCSASPSSSCTESWIAALLLAIVVTVSPVGCVGAGHANLLVWSKTADLGRIYCISKRQRRVRSGYV